MMKMMMSVKLARKMARLETRRRCFLDFRRSMLNLRASGETKLNRRDATTVSLPEASFTLTKLNRILKTH
jgi:hypothetical protein